MRPGEIIIKKEVGTDVQFSCEATGTPPIKYLWFSGKTIANWILTVDSVRSATMTIRNLKTTYTGRYTCQVSNEAGSLNYTYGLIVTGENYFADSFKNISILIVDIMEIL